MLIRHGRSSFRHRTGLLDVSSMRRWREGEDAAGILDDEAAPAGLTERVAEATLLISSDLPRAIQTAERLACGRSFQISPLVREAPPPIPEWISIPMPRIVWELVMLAQWSYGNARGREASPDDLARSARAAAWLDELSQEHAEIAVVTHGVFRRLLTRQLESLGWRGDGRRRSYDNWSTWELSRPS